MKSTNNFVYVYVIIKDVSNIVSIGLFIQKRIVSLPFFVDYIPLSTLLEDIPLSDIYNSPNRKSCHR